MKSFIQLINEKKADKNRKEFEYAKSKESKTFKGTVTQGADKGQSYTIERNPSLKGSRKGIPVNKPRNAPIERSNSAVRDLFKRYGRGEPKATQFVIDMSKDDRKARGLGKRAERVTGASGGKKTGSLRKGNLSFPGDRTGAYSRTKTQIDFDKALRKARGNTEGDLPPEAPKSVKDYAKEVRDKRTKKLGTPDPFDPNYDKKVGNIDGRSKTGKVFKSTKPVTTSSPAFGKGDTPGEIKVKGLEKKTFKVTQPSDIKLPKSFRQFSQNIQDFKDRNKATMRTGPVKKGSAPDQNISRQDVGMAPPDKPKVIKQSEISKQAKSSNVIDFNKFKKEAEAAKNKFRIEADTIAKNPNLTGGEKATQSREVMKKVKTAQNFERGLSNPKKAQTAITLPKDIETVQSAGKPTGSQMFAQNKITGATGPKRSKDVKLPDFTSNRVDLRKVKDSKNEIDFGSKTINPKDTPRARAKRPYSGGPTNYPKRGQLSKALGMPDRMRSSWKTRAKAKQFGAASGVLSGYTKYKQERAKGKSKVSSGVAAGLKGTANFVGTYGGAMLAKKFGANKPIAGLAGLVGGSIANKGYDVTSKTFNRVKNIISPNKKSNPKVPPKPPIEQYKQGQKPRYDISGIVKSSKK